jgi:hypothetical protein
MRSDMHSDSVGVMRPRKRMVTESSPPDDESRGELIRKQYLSRNDYPSYCALGFNDNDGRPFLLVSCGRIAENDRSK